MIAVVVQQCSFVEERIGMSHSNGSAKISKISRDVGLGARSNLTKLFLHCMLNAACLPAPPLFRNTLACLLACSLRSNQLRILSETLAHFYSTFPILISLRYIKLLLFFGTVSLFLSLIYSYFPVGIKEIDSLSCRSFVLTQILWRNLFL